MSRKYIICSSYFARPGSKWEEFMWKLWMRNVMPKRAIMLCTGSIPPPYDGNDLVTAPLKKIHIEGDLGHFMQLVNKEKPHKLCGWTGAMLAGAMLAYNDESDMVYQEQDCLIFGDCIGKMYEEIGDGGIIFGNTDGQPCAQSLFLVKHEYIPEFVRLMLSQGPQAELGNLGEQIFERLERENQPHWKRFSFGYDRTRPLNIKDPYWYAQKFSPDELLELRKAGLVTFDNLPDEIGVFSSTPR